MFRTFVGLLNAADLNLLFVKDTVLTTYIKTRKPSTRVKSRAGKLLG